ncbi:MAG: hypothetical protein FWD64_02595 [Acidobacteriaceae bacterium]|nr:hypothetical protein [Acidobacteriaceae bacterium]
MSSTCVAQTAPVTGAPADQTNPKASAPITKQQAKELFRSVDEILSFASQDTGLPVEHSVKRKLISRDEVSRFLRQKFDDDKDTKRMERSEIVLKKFGLLDRDFNLRPFLLSLLTEQIAGFYDNKTRTVNLLDWIQPDEQKPVLAHELTHALQDQRVDLTRWSEVSLYDPPRNVQDDNRHIQLDEADTAREAVAEGQAMAVFVDYSLQGTGKTLADAPGLAEKMRDSVDDMSGSPILARAPLLLQQSLLFPYDDGLQFEQSLLIQKGRGVAFRGALENPPSSSFEIMNPDAYIKRVPVPVLQLPDIHPLIDADYRPYDIGVMGELDVRILTELFGGRDMAEALAPEWNGGVYYAAQRKSAVTEAQKQSTASIALIYYSQWKNPDSASSFLRVYASEIPRKYSGVARREQDEQDGEQIYSTSEGDVLLSINGSGVFLAEGFPLPLARRLRDSIESVQAEGPLQVVKNNQNYHEPALDMARMIGGFGVMRAGLSRFPDILH